MDNNIHNKYMKRCLELALKGEGLVSPNPLVGCVIVHKNKIIGEGYHHEYGGPHAEVNAIESVKNKELLKEATLYVNLEPCSHKGKTPACSKLIIKEEIPKVVIGAIDSNELVAGKGIAQLRAKGVEVLVNVLKENCLALNKRFYHFHEKKRPYYILKWAESKDGFVSRPLEKGMSPKDNWISNELTGSFTHQMRANEDAILVGKTTAIIDNPSLTTRKVEGKNPIRIIVCNEVNDKLLRTDVLTDGEPTLVFNSEREEKVDNIEYIAIAQEGLISTLNYELLSRGIQSVIIEGGVSILNNFIHENCWDEAYKIIGNKYFKKGKTGPFFSFNPNSVRYFGKDMVLHFVNYTLD